MRKSRKSLPVQPELLGAQLAQHLQQRRTIWCKASTIKSINLLIDSVT